MEPVFRALEITAKALVTVSGTKISYRGLDNIPSSGGAVIAINHTSYIDFLPAALAVHYRGRRMRFMIKAEMQQVRPVNFLIKHTKTIPVDRTAGADAYAAAVEQLRDGDVIGVYPESTISRSFELKDFKSGAARMARDAAVPIVPLIVWGAQRIWTKGYPHNRLLRNKVPISVAVGLPVSPAHDVEQLGAALRGEMLALLHEVQQDYPHPAGAYWVPRRLGGSAPTAAEAAVLDDAELTRRAQAAKRPDQTDR